MTTNGAHTHTHINTWPSDEHVLLFVEFVHRSRAHWVDDTDNGNQKNAINYYVGENTRA